MKIFLSLFILFFSGTAFSQEPKETTFPLTNWVSSSSENEVIIQNGNSLNLVIQISVLSTQAGINIKNCGETKHIVAGNPAICTSNDAKNPVTFSSDSTKPATGTYQIKLQPSAQTKPPVQTQEQTAVEPSSTQPQLQITPHQ